MWAVVGSCEYIDVNFLAMYLFHTEGHISDLEVSFRCFTAQTKRPTRMSFHIEVKMNVSKEVKFECDCHANIHQGNYPDQQQTPLATLLMKGLKIAFNKE